jgi:hypothetical protein
MRSLFQLSTTHWTATRNAGRMVLTVLRCMRGSIILRVFNGEKYLRPCISSVFHAELLQRYPLEIRAQAWRCAMLRPTILDVNYPLRCIHQGRFSDFRKMAGVIGLRESVTSSIYWLITMNHRLYRPGARELLRTIARSRFTHNGSEELQSP